MLAQTLSPREHSAPPHRERAQLTCVPWIILMNVFHARVLMTPPHRDLTVFLGRRAPGCGCATPTRCSRTTPTDNTVPSRPHSVLDQPQALNPTPRAPPRWAPGCGCAMGTRCPRRISTTPWSASRTTGETSTSSSCRCDPLLRVRVLAGGVGGEGVQGFGCVLLQPSLLPHPPLLPSSPPPLLLLHDGRDLDVLRMQVHPPAVVGPARAGNSTRP